MPALGSPWAVHFWACVQVKSYLVCGGSSCWVSHSCQVFSVMASRP